MKRIYPKIGYKPLYLLLCTLIAVTATVTFMTFYMLYQAAFEEERARLVETVQSQARLIEAVARFDRQYSDSTDFGTPFKATLAQIREAHSQFAGFAESGEFVLAHRVNGQIDFLLRHRHSDMDMPEPVPFAAELAEPMRRALKGESGTVIGLDYRGETVLAAYEPVSEYGLGAVAKIDLAEIRSPFVRAGFMALAVAVLLILAGARVFQVVVGTMVQRLEESEGQLAEAQEIGEVGSWQWDVVHNRLYWSDEVYRLFGLDPQTTNASFALFMSHVHPDDREALQQAIENSVDQGAEFEVDYRIVLENGEIRWMHEKANDIRNTQGKSVRRVGTVQDITQRKEYEMELKRSNEELNQALATIKTMSGIVPLCAWCSKKIKDDDGRWVPLEQYFEGHSDAQISHGMCPSCEEKFRNGKL